MKICFNLNGQGVKVDVDPLQPLLHTLREQLGMTSAKQGCGEGECGSCSIIMDNQLVNTCLIPTIQAKGTALVTLEGLKNTPKGLCVIYALLEAKGVQCGFCSPAMVLALYHLLDNRVCADITPTDKQIREALSGNLCRCTGYAMIVEAAKIAARGEGIW
ncbi:MAG: (2Fe-2S)-binding protein [Shewanella sp.]